MCFYVEATRRPTPYHLKHSRAPLGSSPPPFFFFNPAPSQSQTQTNLVGQTEGSDAHRPKTTQDREDRQAQVVLGQNR